MEKWPDHYSRYEGETIFELDKECSKGALRNRAVNDFHPLLSTPCPYEVRDETGRMIALMRDLCTAKRMVQRMGNGKVRARNMGVVK